MKEEKDAKNKNEKKREETVPLLLQKKFMALWAGVFVVGVFAAMMLIQSETAISSDQGTTPTAAAVQSTTPMVTQAADTQVQPTRKPVAEGGTGIGLTPVPGYHTPEGIAAPTKKPTSAARPTQAQYATPTPGTETASTPTPEGTPEITPEATPEGTPEGTPAVTPEGTPAVTPEVTPDTTPGAVPEGTPEVTPEATTAPQATPTPAEVQPTAAPTAQPTPAGKGEE